MSHCTSKVVTRWYYGGRGFNSKLSAYKAAAKEDLLTQVFGAVEKVPFSESSDYQCDGEGRPRLHGTVRNIKYGHAKLVGDRSTYVVEYVPAADFSRALSQGTASRVEAAPVNDFDWDTTMKAVFANGMLEFGFECDMVNGGYDYRSDEPPLPCCDEEFAFCGRKYKAWIKKRAYELMKEDENKA